MTTDNNNSPGQPAAKLPVSRREFGIDKDEFKERLFRMIQRVWQKEYDTAHIKLLRAAKTLIDAEIEKINECRKSKGLPCG